MTTKSKPLINAEVVTYVVAYFDGLYSPVHLERIAVKAYELSPGTFRWDLDEYATFIDKDKVRTSLSDAEKPKGGSLVKGVGPKGRRSHLWRLTAEGSDWMTENADRVSEELGAVLPRIKRSRANKIRRQLIESALYKDYARAAHLEYRPYDFTDLLVCSPDADIEVIQERFETLRGQVKLLQDSELDKFIEACGIAHTRILTNVK
jgi:hypothetical protein